jgi:hypothetical protein
VAGENGERAPGDAATAVDFVAELRRLKERSGLTFRQLEERAAGHGDLLPRSTIADVLRRPTLPRADLVTAFVRACGGTPDDVAAWLAVHARLAAMDGETPSTVDGDEAAAVDGDALPAVDGDAPAGPPPARRWLGRTRVVVAAAAVVAVAAVGSWMLVRGEEPPAAAPTTSSPAPPTPPLAGTVRIHPARTPDLCVTEGVDRGGRYTSAVAAQLPCAEAEPPVTRLEPAGDDRYFIQWVHPQHGVGCLTALISGPGRGLVEPWSECNLTSPHQVFQLDPSGPGRYVIRGWRTGLCLGIRGEERVSGAEIVHEECSGGADQEYVIEPRA